MRLRSGLLVSTSLSLFFFEKQKETPLYRSVSSVPGHSSTVVRDSWAESLNGLRQYLNFWTLFIPTI